jgi:putative membrane protein
MIEAVLQSFLSGFPYFLLHFLVTCLLLVLGVLIYIWITPHREVDLIRQGNLAAAVSLAGAILGIALPLALSMSASYSVSEIVIWGAVAVAIQLVVFKAIDLVFNDLSRRIENGEIAPAMVLAATKLSVAAINAAAMAG